MENNDVTFYLAPFAYDLLKKDQNLFHFGSNKSDLIKKIILNYYPEYGQEMSNLEAIIKNAIALENSSKISKDDKECSNIAWKITKYLSESTIIKSEESNKEREKMHLRINKNDDDLETIINSYPLDASRSAFIASIIYSYLKKPQYERERIVFKDVFDKLEEAIANNKKVKIKSKSNNRNKTTIQEIEPREICISKEELFNYLLYKGLTKKNKREYANSIHLYNILTVVEKPENCSFNDKIISYFERMKRNGVQFRISSKTIYKVKLTEHGKALYNDLLYLERPVALESSKPDLGIYEFDCSRMQFENYFAPFFDNVLILEPKNYKDKYYRKVSKKILITPSQKNYNSILQKPSYHYKKSDVCSSNIPRKKPKFR